MTESSSHGHLLHIELWSELLVPFVNVKRLILLIYIFFFNYKNLAFNWRVGTYNGRKILWNYFFYLIHVGHMTHFYSICLIFAVFFCQDNSSELPDEFGKPDKRSETIPSYRISQNPSDFQLISLCSFLLSIEPSPVWSSSSVWKENILTPVFGWEYFLQTLQKTLILVLFEYIYTVFFNFRIQRLNNFLQFSSCDSWRIFVQSLSSSPCFKTE